MNEIFKKNGRLYRLFDFVINILSCVIFMKIYLLLIDFPIKLIQFTCYPI